MMKRMIALLLAVLLLPAAALAEAFRLDVTVSLDKGNAAKVFKNAGLFAGNTYEDDLCTAFADFMDGFAFSLIAQDDAASMTIAFDKTPLLDLSIITRAEDVLITSSLMNGSALSLPVSLMSAEEKELTRLLAESDWLSVLGGMVEAAVRSFDAVEGTTVRGSFSGDAYSGGVFCTTYTFDDKDVAGLVSALLTEDFRALLSTACAVAGMDGAGILADVDAANEKAAADNRHRYIVRLVYDAQMAPVGLSAVVLQGERQLGTLSLGFEEGGLRIVVGFGLDDVNYWHSHEISVSNEQTADGYESIVLSGSLLEFTAPKSDDYAYASRTYKDQRMVSDWQVKLVVEGSNMTWNYSIEQQMGKSAPGTLTEGRGLYINGSRLVNTCTYAMNGTVYMTEKLTGAPCDPIATSGNGLSLVSATDEGAADELAMTVAFGIVERLMKVLPRPMLMLMQ